MRVKIQTMLGDIVVLGQAKRQSRARLYDETPIHRDNFVKQVKEGYYDGTLFHRVIKDFMIQGGDPDSKGAPKKITLMLLAVFLTLTAEAQGLKKVYNVMKRLNNCGRFGFPVFVVLDDSGYVIHIQDSSFLEEGQGYNQEKVMRFFKNWTLQVVKN